MSAVIERRRFTREEYHRLGETGILREDDRVELLDGELIVMSPVGKRHVKVVRDLMWLFQKKLDVSCVVECQSPFILGEDSQPQPDFLLLRPEMRQSEELAVAEDIFLVVEVSDSSLNYDRLVKLRAYALGNIAEVWILNLAQKVVEVYRQPTPTGYGMRFVAQGADSLTVEALPAVTFSVAELLP